MKFKKIGQRLAVCRLGPDAQIPANITSISFLSITRTEDELSIVLPETLANSAWEIEPGWQGLKIEGPLDFSMVGVVAKISAPLADAGIPIFVISTFDTDYLLTKDVHFENACKILKQQGHSILAE
ncbi:MAG: ACT domain-containing protein [Rhodothermales bacterium]